MKKVRIKKHAHCYLVRFYHRKYGKMNKSNHIYDTYARAEKEIDKFFRCKKDE